MMVTAALNRVPPNRRMEPPGIIPAASLKPLCAGGSCARWVAMSRPSPSEM
jgi:hypothetical protein